MECDVVMDDVSRIYPWGGHQVGLAGLEASFGASGPATAFAHSPCKSSRLVLKRFDCGENTRIAWHFE